MTTFSSNGFDPSDVSAIAGSGQPAPVDPSAGTSPSPPPQNSNPMLPAAWSDHSNGRGGAIARAALGAGLSSVAGDWNKPALAAFAGGAGGALQGGGQAENQMDQQDLAWRQARAKIINDNLNLMIKARAAGDMDTWRQAQLKILEWARNPTSSSTAPPVAAPPPAAAASPQPSATIPSALGDQTAATFGDQAGEVLGRYGYSGAEIAAMTPEQRQARAGEAVEAGISVADLPGRHRSRIEGAIREVHGEAHPDDVALAGQLMHRHGLDAHDALALQLLFCFEVRSLSERLVSSTPE